ncbi:oligosaccharide flippase family protein [Vibrio parahaemolyticus]
MKSELIKALATKIYIVMGSFILIIYTANELGSFNRGALGAALAIVGFCQTIFYMSLGQIIYSKIIKGSDREEIKSSLNQVKTYNLFIIPIILFLVGLILYLYDIFSFNLAVLSTLCVCSLIIEQQLTSICLSQGFSNKINVTQLISKTLYFFISYILVFYSSLSYHGVLIAYLISTIFSIYMLRTISRQVYKEGSFVITNFIPILKDAIKLHINAFGQALFTQSPLLIVGLYVMLEELANIELAFKIVGVYFVIGQASQQVILSKMSNLKELEALNTIKKVMLYSVLCLSAAMIFGFFLIDVFVDNLLTEEFYEVSVVFKQLVPIVIPFCLNMTLLSAYIRYEMFNLASRNNIVIGIISALSTLIFCYFLGGRGFIYSYYFTSAVMLYFVITVIKKLEVKYNNEDSISM